MTLEEFLEKSNEESRQEARQEGLREGRREGLTEGKQEILKLISLMSETEDGKEIPRLAQEKEFLEEMMKKYDLV